MTAPGAQAVNAPAGAGLPRLATLIVFATLLASLAGAALAGYLVYENARGDSGVCVIAHGCSTVQGSRYGKLLGIPVSVPGFTLYAGLAALSILWLRNAMPGRPNVTALAFLGSLFGVLFSAYLTYLEAFVIDAWCIYCIASAILMSAIFLGWAALLAAGVSGSRFEALSGLSPD